MRDISSAPKKELSLFDSTSIIVGIIIGAGIYETAPLVAAGAGGPVGVLGVWLAGGIMALAGALCYAELATAWPREGGDYVYLSRAWGRAAGYMFGWSQMVIVRPGDIALMAFIFARYARTIYNPFEHSEPVYAAIAVTVLTALNVLGVKESKWTQNALTILKTLGLAAIVVIGFVAPANTTVPADPSGFSMSGLKLSLILVLFTFGGWNEMAYVAAEIKRPERNILRGLVIGTVTVTFLYVLVNGAFLHTLGYDKMTASNAVAVDTLAAVAPHFAGKVFGILVCISALGAVNGLIFTGARISYALGTDHRVFRSLGKWDKKSGTPVRALVAQGCISLLIILVAGSFVDTILYTAPVVWLFFLGTGLSVLILRKKEPTVARPYKITGYPFTSLFFVACCVFMLYSSVTFAFAVKPKSLIVLSATVLLGLVIYVFTED